MASQDLSQHNEESLEHCQTNNDDIQEEKEIEEEAEEVLEEEKQLEGKELEEKLKKAEQNRLQEEAQEATQQKEIEVLEAKLAEKRKSVETHYINKEQQRDEVEALKAEQNKLLEKVYENEAVITTCEEIYMQHELGRKNVVEDAKALEGNLKEFEIELEGVKKTRKDMGIVGKRILLSVFLALKDRAEKVDRVEEDCAKRAADRDDKVNELRGFREALNLEKAELMANSRVEETQCEKVSAEKDRLDAMLNGRNDKIAYLKIICDGKKQEADEKTAKLEDAKKLAEIRAASLKKQKEDQATKEEVYQKEKDQWTRSLAELEETKEKLIVEACVESAKKTFMVEVLKQKKDQQKIAEDEKAVVLSEISSVIEQRNRMKDKLRALEESNRQVTSEMETTKAHLVDNLASLAESEAAVDQIKVEVASMEASAKALQGDATDLTRKEKVWQLVLQANKDCNQEGELELEGLEADLDKQKEERAALELQVAKVNESSRGVHLMLAESEAKLTAAKEAMYAANNEMADLASDSEKSSEEFSVKLAALKAEKVEAEKNLQYETQFLDARTLVLEKVKTRLDMAYRNKKTDFGKMKDAKKIEAQTVRDKVAVLANEIKQKTDLFKICEELNKKIANRRSIIKSLNSELKQFNVSGKGSMRPPSSATSKQWPAVVKGSIKKRKTKTNISSRGRRGRRIERSSSDESF